MSRRIAVIGLLVAAGAVLHYLESAFLPFIHPWRLGVANLVSLVALELLGLKSALLVAAVRCLLGGLLSGNLMALTLGMSEAGALSSTVVMAALLQRRSLFSLVGVSVAGALASNAAQLAVLALTVVKAAALYGLVVYLWPSALAGGVLCGVLAHATLARLHAGRASPRS